MEEDINKIIDRYIELSGNIDNAIYVAELSIINKPKKLIDVVTQKLLEVAISEMLKRKKIQS